jgi:hypothetical protein
MVPVVLFAYNLPGGVAHASAAVPAPSTGTIGILGPQSASGPVDTLVTLEVREYASDAPTYVLAATTNSPDQGGCMTAKHLSGVPLFQLSPGRAPDLQFHWPAGLGRGRYWFCASPVSGTGPTAMSLASQPFTVLTDAAPTVQITAPSGSIQAGAQVTVTIANWLTSDTSLPFEPLFVPHEIMPYTIWPVAVQVDRGRSNPTAGAYIMMITLPSYVASGSGPYVLVAQGECGPDPLGNKGKTVCAVSEQSPFFTIVALSTPMNPMDPFPSRPAGPDPLWLVAPAAGILMLVLGLAAILRRPHTTNTLRR